MHGNTDGTPRASLHFVGDSLVNGVPEISPVDQAKALLEYMSNFAGRWVAARDLERYAYPMFLKQMGRPDIPWLTVARALGKVTKKRYKEFSPSYQDDFKRQCRTEYLSPKQRSRSMPRSPI